MKQTGIVAASLLFFLFVSPSLSHAEDKTPEPNYDAYDFGFEGTPAFSSELEEEQAEETYFHEGRFLNAGLRGGFRTFTQNLGNIYDIGPAVGGFFDYFLSSRFATELALDASFHRFKLKTSESGTVTLFDILLRLKWYPFAESEVETLALVNPYFGIGVGEYFRFTSSAALPTSNRENAFGIDVTTGLDYPVSSNHLFLGLQVVYHFIFFGDESRTAADGSSLSGDAFSMLGVLTYNF